MASLPLLSCSTPHNPSEPAVKPDQIERFDLTGQDVANFLGITAGKFSFALSKSSAITCWVDAYDRGVMKPQEVIRVDVPSTSKKGDVIIFLGRLGNSSEETIQVYLSVVTYSDGVFGSTTYRSTDHATVENFFQGMSHGTAWEGVSVEYGKEIVLWKLAGSRGEFGISGSDTLEELVNKSDKTLILNIRFSEK